MRQHGQHSVLDSRACIFGYMVAVSICKCTYGCYMLLNSRDIESYSANCNRGLSDSDTVPPIHNSRRSTGPEARENLSILSCYDPSLSCPLPIHIRTCTVPTRRATSILELAALRSVGAST